MNHLKLVSVFTLCAALVACSPAQLPVNNEYQLTAYSTQQLTSHPKGISIWLTTPEAAAGYQTEQMLYVNKPYELSAFTKNSWASAPGNMLHPLMVQSLQASGVFHAVMSSAYSQGADYRLDTQLLSLEQNFLKKPSVLELSVKVVLTRVEDNKVMASRIFTQRVACPANTPYGGVVAANRATQQFTAALTRFVMAHINK